MGLASVCRRWHAPAACRPARPARCLAAACGRVGEGVRGKGKGLGLGMGFGLGPGSGLGCGWVLGWVLGCLGDGQREQRVDALARVEGAHLGEARVHHVVHLGVRVGVLGLGL